MTSPGPRWQGQNVVTFQGDFDENESPGPCWHGQKVITFQGACTKMTSLRSRWHGQKVITFQSDFVQNEKSRTSLNLGSHEPRFASSPSPNYRQPAARPLLAPPPALCQPHWPFASPRPSAPREPAGSSLYLRSTFSLFHHSPRLTANCALIRTLVILKTDFCERNGR